MKLPPLLVSLLLCIGSTTVGQTSSKPPSDFIQHASIVQKPGGNLTIVASSPRPVLQALTAIRRQYGWILDYEEGRYSSADLAVDADGQSRLRGGAFQLTLPAPKSIAAADEASFLQTFLSAAQGVLSEGSELQPGPYGRYSVLAQNSQEPLMLDTQIHLARATRTIDETIAAIVNLVSEKRGVSFQRGGLIDSGLLRTEVTIGSTSEMKARDLLIGALNAADAARVWSVSFEPSDGNFYIGIELAVRAVTDVTGKQKVTPIWNPAIQKP